jgi:hypothetical protein
VNKLNLAHLQANSFSKLVKELVNLLLAQRNKQIQIRSKKKSGRIQPLAKQSKPKKTLNLVSITQPKARKTKAVMMKPAYTS